MRQKKQRVEINNVGQYLSGRVLNVGTTASGAAFVDVGRGRPCMLLPEDWDGTVETGQVLHAWVKQINWEDGHVLLTMFKPRRDVHELEVGELLNGTVTHVDEKFGGIFLDVHAKRDGLLLGGQLTAEVNASLTEPIKPGFQMNVWVKDVRDHRTFSLTTFAPRRPLEELSTGENLQGTVRKMPSFGGAFVDVGAEKDGWLPEHELSGGALLEPPEIGQKVEVWIKELSKEKGLQLTLEKPGKGIDRLRVGEALNGTVTGTSSFGGIFVDVGAVRDGLVHADCMGEGGDSVEIGQEVKVWVKQRKGDWSLQLTMVKPQVSYSQLRVGRRVRGRVTGVNQLGGAFFDIGFVNDALLRYEEMTPEVQQGPPAEVLVVGQEEELWIKAVNRDGKIDLTMRKPQAASRGVGWRGKQAPARRGIL